MHYTALCWFHASAHYTKSATEKKPIYSYDTGELNQRNAFVCSHTVKCTTMRGAVFKRKHCSDSMCLNQEKLGTEAALVMCHKEFEYVGLLVILVGQHGVVMTTTLLRKKVLLKIMIYSIMISLFT